MPYGMLALQARALTPCATAPAPCLVSHMGAGTQALGHHLLPPRHISRELDQKPSSRDSNAGCWHQEAASPARPNGP